MKKLILAMQAAVLLSASALAARESADLQQAPPATSPVTTTDGSALAVSGSAAPSALINGKADASIGGAKPSALIGGKTDDAALAAKPMPVIAGKAKDLSTTAKPSAGIDGKKHDLAKKKKPVMLLEDASGAMPVTPSAKSDTVPLEGKK